MRPLKGISLCLSIFFFAQTSSADYYDLARRIAEREAAAEIARREADHARSIQEFNRKITKLVYGFARAHRGFVGGAPRLEMNSLIPGRILRYVFATNDGYECAAASDFWRATGASLDCIHSRTEKRLNLKRP